MTEPLLPAAGRKVRIRHIHIPDVSIPDSERSETESRAVAWRIQVGMGRAIVRVVTGDFTLHKDLAAQVADVTGTKFGLPKSMPYESAVLLGLLSEAGHVSIFSTAHGSRPGARMSEEDAYTLLRFAAAGVARAIRRGYGLDHIEPPGIPYDLDQFPEPTIDTFDVTAEMLAEFEVDVRDGVVTLHEEISWAAAAAILDAPAIGGAGVPTGPNRRPRKSIMDYIDPAASDEFQRDET